MRWIQMRAQMRGDKPSQRHVNALRAIDQRLREVRVFFDVDRIGASPHDNGDESIFHVGLIPSEEVISNTWRQGGSQL